MTPRPLSPYAVGKLTGEHYLRIFAGLYGMETLTLRYFNVFGPHQDAGSPYSGVMGLFITALLAAARPVVYGDGRQSRDFTYMDNVVDANLRALAARGAARAGASTWPRAARSRSTPCSTALARVTGRPAGPARYRPRAPGDIRHSLADITLARRCSATGRAWTSRPACERTVDWYRRRSRR